MAYTKDNTKYNIVQDNTFGEDKMSNMLHKNMNRNMN